MKLKHLSLAAAFIIGLSTSAFSQSTQRAIKGQKPLTEGLAGQKQIPPFSFANEKKILVESNDSANLQPCLRSYASLVNTIADTLQNSLKIKKTEHLRFANNIYSIIRGLGYRYGNDYFGYVYLSLSWRKLDCDNAATLVYDVAVSYTHLTLPTILRV